MNWLCFSYLNRTTFYLHYQHHDDLIAQLMQDILHEVNDKIDTLIQVQEINECHYTS